jgi:hypothetical protein
VRNRGPVTTYGANDMVLDNWGVVDRWVADDKITSHGPSGIGLVNFGTINVLEMNAPIETFGQGARGFNVYIGTVKMAEFERPMPTALLAYRSASRLAASRSAAASRLSAVPATLWSKASSSSFRPLRSASNPAAPPVRSTLPAV